jgi:predicted RNA-binding protein with PIN domain
MKAQSAILEPFFSYRLEIPQGSLGRAISDIERFSGKFLLEESDGETAVLTGTAPVSEMRGYQREVAAYTGGRGRLFVSLQGYGPCHNPDQVWQDMYYNPERDTENTADSVFCSHGAGVVVPWYAVERYMHLPGAGLPDYSGVTGLDLDWYDVIEEEEAPDLSARETGEGRTIRRRKKTAAAPMGDDDELRAIFERTYGPIKTRLHDTSVTIRAGEEKEYVYKEKKKKPVEEYLLVDGYNIIFSWDDLRQLGQHNMDAARDTLLEIMSGYAGYMGGHVIVVFDAYKVKGFKGEVTRWKNLDVVFTKEAETADQYIEKTAHEIGRKHKVTVATSDGTEQIIIRGQGCLLMSSTELHKEIERIHSLIREEHTEKTERSGHYLGEYLPDWKTFTS